MSRIGRLNLAMRQPEDVIPHLGKPTHWKEGRSAKSLADAWFAANDVPADVRAVLDKADEYRGATLIDAFLERCTDLQDGRGTPSQTDLLAILATDSGLSVMGVEAKVIESFGPIVEEWLDGASGKEQRLQRLCAQLDLDRAAALRLRYQLLHRTVAAMLEARRYRTSQALMLVQSFCPERTGFADFAAFVEALGFGAIEPDRLSPSRELSDLNVRLGWVASAK
ncbi:hypothetical protein [Sphingomonas sp. LHG3406-1]|uniref:DUF6946 family protein n=1 Tax=Sphingomonas sp. LHG3406-1 TaxID=2804617 RepID=UPI00262CE058|nr:hypothetical protein [Sphingomonas sp. LHG3406-1]